MKSSTIFRKAAELVFKDRVPFACNAIDEVALTHPFQYNRSPERIAFVQHFDPQTGDEAFFGPLNEENKLARQLALLLMVELSKDLEK